MLALHTKASSLDSFMKETLKLKALIPNPDEPEPKKKKKYHENTKGRKHESLNVFLFRASNLSCVTPFGLEDSTIVSG